MMKIQRNIGREEAVSRIPGLFAYLEYSEYGGCVLHIASDSPDGCYGKVVEAIEVPIGLTVDGEVVIGDNEVCTYREMMNAYYTYRDDDRVGRDHPFIRFVDDGIGLIDLMEYARSNGVSFSEVPPLAPEFVYLAQITRLIEKMRRLKYACDLSEYADSIGEHDVEACCLCEQYEQYGGDRMFGLLKELSEEYVRRAELYHLYAREGRGHFSLNIPLYGTAKDIGYMDVYSDELGEGKYCKGSFVTITEVDGEGYYIDMNTYTVKEDAEFEAEPCTGTVITENEGAEMVKKVAPEPLCGDEGVVFNTETRSRLKSLRSGRRYMDIYENEIAPSEREDWLWYYKIGNRYNTRKADDENCFTDTIKSVSVMVDTYGGEITEAKLRFIYNIGQRITRTCEEGACTEWEEDPDVCGMTFTEDYNVIMNDDWVKIFGNSGLQGGTGGEFVGITDELGDLYTLITEADGVDLLIDGDTPRYDDRRFPFRTDTNLAYRDRIVGTKTVTDEYISGKYEQTVMHSWEDELMASPIFKTDSLSSLTFRPDVHNDIYIQRGDSAAFERHIRLSEIKTLDDLMQYSNGGYYQVVELT